ncbi:MAG: hypothetical protein HYX34_01425 [Actinobacteria bacterium]|nr:hypothetical protein [Actinomycetota bacterium]
MDDWPEDELMARLRAADPVEPDLLPGPTTAAATALHEEITMTPTLRSGHRDRAGTGRRTTTLVAAAVVVVVIVAGAAALAAVNSGDGGAPQAAPDRRPPVTTGPSTTAPPPPGSLSCVTRYDLTTLVDREVAFEGTVTRVAGDSVTFTVDRAFKGVEGSTVTLRGAEVLGGTTSAGPGVDLSPGSRLLVSGDGGFAWGCGFTRPWDGATASRWAGAFG